MPATPAIDFATVLACSVHDMKNSLCLLVQSAELVQAEGDKLSGSAREELARLNYEASRLNSNLLKLLSLYRLERQQLPLQVEQHFIAEIFEELVLKNQYFASQRGIEVIVRVDENLCWYFDRDLIINVMNDAMANALRYSEGHIELCATLTEDSLLMSIADDGPGFPDFMLQNATPDMNKLDLQHGHTGLGIFFAKLIAQAHRNKKLQGRVMLNNCGHLNGGTFSIQLP